MGKIQLGGNISIEGFEGLEPAKVIVAKKMIGLFAKKTSTALGSLDAFEVTLAGNSIAVHAKSGERVLEEKAEDANMFVALSKALTEVVAKAR